MPTRLLLLLQTFILLTAYPVPSQAATIQPLPEGGAPAPLTGGLLQPGWQATAEQALGDIRAVALQMPGGAVPASNLGSDAGLAKAVIEAFLKAPNAAAPGRQANAWVTTLINPLWQANVSSAVAGGGAADRISQAFTLGNAALQLGRSVYGGPPGAAAYAAWWAYRQPGATPAQALRVGLLAGAGLWAAQLGDNGTAVAAPVIQRTSLAAALGGLAVAAAGGDEQALREVFFGVGAAALLQQGSQVYCLSATVQCQPLPATAALYRGGRFAGWAVDRLTPVAAQAGVAFPDAPAHSPAATAAMPRPHGSLSLGQGWTMNWYIPQGIERGLLYPLVVLTRQPGAASSANPAPLPGPVQPRYVCARGGDTRAIWVVPGNSRGGYVCRTLYRVGSTQTVLWNARQNPEACEAKARAQVNRERAKGYRCNVVEGQGG
ncbi:hypothetical protein [Pseudomonas typographi]|uniref:Uncharacterized protein n=1 Tax=Pseudomonas typographi TaxID=2715964 RepID=A0ABR7Z1U9_9PSED|nr:hypothetical protein [Pseudomonas typographi]MBD1599348.1 hypothetical protein [Pseudomonas typographi]